MEEKKTSRTIIALCALIGGASIFICVNWYLLSNYLWSDHSPTYLELTIGAALVLCSALVSGLLGARMWRAEWAVRALLALSGAAGIALFFVATQADLHFGRSALTLLAVVFFGASLLPAIAHLRMFRGRDGRSDGRGHIDFLDGGHGRTERRHEGAIVAWVQRGEGQSGYREDGDMRRYRIVPGTREGLVARSRKRAALLVLIVLAVTMTVSATYIAYLSMTHDPDAYMRERSDNPGLK